MAKDDPLGEPVEKVVYLDQGWSPAVSLKFYFTSQGSQIIPYDWFLALEQADSQTLFRDNQNILKYRYLPQLPDSNNPDGLPVGFVGDTGVGRRWLGLTCAACHTNEIRYGTTGYRVDGAPTQGDVRALLAALITAMQKTRDDPAKLERFAAKVLGNLNSPSGQSLLKAQLAAAIDKRIAYNLRNFPGYNPNEPAPAPADYARLDAVGAIVKRGASGWEQGCDGSPVRSPCSTALGLRAMPRFASNRVDPRLLPPGPGENPTVASKTRPAKSIAC